MHIIQSDLIDVVVEATGIPEVGAEMAYHTLMHKKHLVMVNVETDVTVGPFLRRLADNAGVVYTLVDGDQPGVTMNIVEWAKVLGFEIVAAGRGTVFYDDDRIWYTRHRSRNGSGLVKNSLNGARLTSRCSTRSATVQKHRLR